MTNTPPRHIEPSQMSTQAAFSSLYEDQPGLYAVQNGQELPDLQQPTNFSTQYREGFPEESQLLACCWGFEVQCAAQTYTSTNGAGYNGPLMTPGDYEVMESEYGYKGTYTQPPFTSTHSLITVLRCVGNYPSLTTDTVANDSSLPVFKCMKRTPMAVLDVEAQSLTKMLLESNLIVHGEQANAAALVTPKL